MPTVPFAAPSPLRDLQSTTSRHRVLASACVALVGVVASATISLARPIVAATNRTCVVTPAGGVKCWGRNVNGQVGDGTRIDRLAAVDVLGLSGDVVTSLAGGTVRTCALTTAGAVKCWGGANLIAADVPGLTSGITSVTAGIGHVCVLTSAGGVKCWGDNAYGQLGDGTKVDRSSPVVPNGLASGVQSVWAGFFHTCAVTSTGAAKCWGRNDWGQLGDGSKTERHEPVDVLGLTSGVEAIAGSNWHSCALVAGGKAKCWGRNSLGQLGDGTTTNRPTPVDVVAPSGSIKQLSAGGSFTCALLSNNRVRCWGWNVVGELGDGSTADSSVATKVRGLKGKITAISAHDLHACALGKKGKVWCWGTNIYGALGTGVPTLRTSPVDVIGLQSGVAAIVAGDKHNCARMTTGKLKCWGLNLHGQLGNQDTADSGTPVDATLLTGTAKLFGAGANHTCIRSGPGAKCWGSNAGGVLGGGVFGHITSAVDVVDLATPRILDSGGTHACAVRKNRKLACWGENPFGQLGDGSLTGRATPANVVGLPKVKSVSGGTHYTCAVTKAGAAYCWGLNAFGRLGDGTTQDRSLPVNVSTLTSGILSIAASGQHTCALTDAGAVKCWGYNLHGQLGNGTKVTTSVPVNVVGLSGGVVRVDVGADHSCALTSGGLVKCWGHNLNGELGDGTDDASTTPVNVSGLTSGVKEIAAGDDHTCALTTTGAVKCWGNNFNGQLGNGDLGYSTTATRAVGVP